MHESIERDLGALRTVTGRVIIPSDPDYDEATIIPFAGFDNRPAAIARVATTEDVVKVVRFASDTGVDLAVRSGGHSSAGHSTTDGGVVLDLRDMRDLEVNVENRTAWADTGLTTGDYTTATAEHGLTTGFGDTPTVGIGGITLSGGLGFLLRKHGLTIDNVLAAEVVTADGSIVRTDADSHPGLFWAIRGGGGNFGVVTRIKFRLHPVDQVTGGMIMFPATPDVITGLVDFADSAPDDLTTMAQVVKAPPIPFLPPEVHGELVFMAMVAFAGEEEEGEKQMAELRNLGEPMVDMLARARYVDLLEGPPEDMRPHAEVYPFFRDTLDTNAAEQILTAIDESDAFMSPVQMRVMGGAVARVPNDATAFAHRDRKIMMNVASMYQNPEEKAENAAWVQELATTLGAEGQGAYVGFQGYEGGAGALRAYPPATWERLQRIKTEYDPDNLFHRNQNIPPLG